MTRIPTDLDIARLRPDSFETIRQAKAENDKRRAILLKAAGKLAKLARKIVTMLKDCHPEYPCGLACCRICTREFRRHFVAEGMGMFCRASPLVMITLVLSEDDSRPEKLNNVDLKKLKQRVRMRIRRAGLADRPWLAGIEFDYDKASGRWEFHLHAVTTGHPNGLRKALKKVFSATDEITRPVRIDPVHDLPGALSYLLKFMPRAKVPYPARTQTKASGEPKIYTRSRRLADGLGQQAYTWLASQKPSDFVFRIAGSAPAAVIEAGSE